MWGVYTGKVWLRLFFEPKLSRINTPHSQPQSHFIPTRLWRWSRQSVPKCWHLNCRRRWITQKKAYDSFIIDGENRKGALTLFCRVIEVCLSPGPVLRTVSAFACNICLALLEFIRRRMLIQNTLWNNLAVMLTWFKIWNSLSSLCRCNNLDTTFCLNFCPLPPPERDQSSHVIITASWHRSMLVTQATRTAHSCCCKLSVIGPLRLSQCQAEPDLCNIMHL
jgi:hypothetical protein